MVGSASTPHRRTPCIAAHLLKLHGLDASEAAVLGHRQQLLAQLADDLYA